MAATAKAAGVGMRHVELGEPMRLLCIIACLVVPGLAGCESYDSLHQRRHAYRAPFPGEIRPIARLAMTEDQLAEKEAAALRRPPAKTATPTAGDRIIFIKGRRPILPKIQEAPVIDIRPGLRSLTDTP